MLKLKEQVFGQKGYSADMKLSAKELDFFRARISEHWLSHLSANCPGIVAEAEKLGIENYHLIADRIDHKGLWPKINRVFPQEVVNQIKKFPFLAQLKDEFGEFAISDVIEVKQHYGREEVYWRLVRPNVESDVGSLHKDSWFHGAINSGYGMYTKDQVTVKIWIPIYCEPGKSGLCLLGGSHLREWKYHLEEDETGVQRPVPDEDLIKLGAALVPTGPGNLLIFNEDILHGGVVNKSNKTRVSAEITMVMARANFSELMNSQKRKEHV